MNTTVSQSSYRLTENELALWLKFIEHHVGFVLPITQQSWIKGIIERYLFKLKLENSQFFQQICNNKTLFHQFFDEILIPRTQFFRHQATFDVLSQYAAAWKHQQYLNARFDSKKPAANTLEPDFVAWSVGSATGQEPVSLSLTLAQVFASVAHFKIYASDYHQQALATAKQGKYDIAQMAFIPKDYHTWLQPIPNENRFAISPLLMDGINYFSFNLVQRQSLIPVLPKQCQIIMCQNVLIYFRQFEQRDIIHFLSQYLADEGMLVMGVGEATHINTPSLIKIPSTKVDILVKSNAPTWVKELAIDLGMYKLK